MNRLTDGGCTSGQTHGKIILLSHILVMTESDVASLIEFCQVV